ACYKYVHLPMRVHICIFYIHVYVYARATHMHSAYMLRIPICMYSKPGSMGGESFQQETNKLVNKGTLLVFSRTMYYRYVRTVNISIIRVCTLNMHIC